MVKITIVTISVLRAGISGSSQLVELYCIKIFSFLLVISGRMYLSLDSR